MFLLHAVQRLFQRILLWRCFKTKDPDGCLCRYPVKETEGRRRRRRRQSSSLSRIINLWSRGPPGSPQGRPPRQLFSDTHLRTRRPSEECRAVTEPFAQTIRLICLQVELKEWNDSVVSVFAPLQEQDFSKWLAERFSGGKKV